MTRARTTLVRIAVATACALAATACGGNEGGEGDAGKVDGREVDAVRSCLEEAGFEVRGLDRGDLKLVDGVSGTKAGQDPDDVAYAGAGHAKRDRDVAAFERSTRKAKEQQSEADRERLTIDAGTTGRYVWAVGGVTDSAGLAAARKCVEP